jgi:WD40 repeat protein
MYISNDILYSGSLDKTIKLWNKNTGDLLRTLSGHGNLVWSVAFDSNDIRIENLSSVSWKRSVKFFGKFFCRF